MRLSQSPPTERRYAPFVIKSAFFLTLYLSTNSIELFKDGGARPQGISFFSFYSGPLNWIEYFWFGSVSLLLAIYLKAQHLRNYFFSSTFTLFIVIATFMLLSSVFAREPLYSIGNSAKIIAAYLCIKIYVINSSAEKIASDLTRFFLTMLVSSLILVLFVPSYGISVGSHEGRWQGLFNHKNALGSFSCLAFIFSISFPHIRSRWRTVLIILSAFLIVKSESTTAFIVALIGLTTLGAIKISKKIKLHSVVFSIIPYVALTIPLILFFIAMQKNTFELLGKDTTFSLRSSIWQCAIPTLLDEPLLGHGITQFERNILNNDYSILRCVGFIPSNLHNGFIDIAYSLGFPILILMLLSIVALNAKSPPPLRTYTTVFTVALVTFNSLEAEFLAFCLPFCMFAVILSMTEHSSPRFSSITLSGKKRSGEPITSSNFKKKS